MTEIQPGSGSQPGTTFAQDQPDLGAVRSFLDGFQNRVCEMLEEIEGEVCFRKEEIPRAGGGVSRPQVLEEGAVIEKAAVNFTQSFGQRMPAAATERRPELAGRTYEAISVSLIVHPQNPYVPTCHANFRFFLAKGLGDLAQDEGDSKPVWWFGGGFDCTPYYGFEEDAVHWHQTAHDACAAHGADLYARFKANCDDYFYLPHRDEQRGIGGLFYDDFDDGGFAASFALWKSTADAFITAYEPILRRRKDMPWGERERDFQLYRRGRYVEFNLLQDRGTRFGLEAGARTESVLASLPSQVAWKYNWAPEPGTEEAKLYTDFLQPRDWLDGPS